MAGCPTEEDTKTDTKILVMNRALINNAYSISFDGTIKTPAAISAPSDNYLRDARSALVKGDLYVFGGSLDKQRVTDNF